VSKRSFVFASSLLLLASTFVFAADRPKKEDSDKIVRHVLLISVDGLHALDVANYVASHPKSALAELSSHAITYSNARTPSLSDSFPGLLALVTGGSPITTGLFYDVSYDHLRSDEHHVYWRCRQHDGF
jgi:predicted AlkP superfamily pyrophosphatase or phosphodiesterase